MSAPGGRSESVASSAALAAAPASPASRARLLRAAGVIVPLILLAAGLWILQREITVEHLKNAIDSSRSIPVRKIVLAALLTIASYLTLSLYDFTGLRYLRKRLRRARVMFASFIAFAFAHSLSFAAFTGAAVRYRLYGRDGLSLGDVATLSAYNAATLSVGFALVAGLSFLFEPIYVASALHLIPEWTRVLGVFVLCVVVAYVLFAARRTGQIRLGKWQLRTAGPALASLQLLIGVLDLTIAAAVLWVLLPAQADINLLAFGGIYVIACVAGVLSHVPGGAGVFESVFLLLLPNVPREQLLGSLIVYRLLYYIAPLCLAAAMFGLREIANQGSRLAVWRRAAELYVGAIIPQVAAGAVFLAAIVLLLSGVTPEMDTHLAKLARVLPVPVLELSHLIGSAVGVALLMLARALFRKVRVAYDIAFWLLTAGIAASLLKSFDFTAAAILAIALALLHLGRRSFYRSSALLYERLTPAWIASVVAVLVLVTYIGFVSYREVAYSDELWWRFAMDAHASRMLRGSLVAAIVASVLILANLLGPPRHPDQAGAAVDLDRVQTALKHADAAVAQAVLAGDKRVLLNDAGNAFLMYQVARSSWVALGDPVGERHEQQSLAWKFRELSDSYGGRTVFYQVSAERLWLYVEMGLELLKLGEEAVVPLANFSLDGRARAELRQGHRRVANLGATFEIVPAGQAESLMPELKAISDAWLGAKHTAEKRFSIGSFSPAYLQYFPIALVRCESRPVAFANLWTTVGKQELSVDLMRFAGAAPRGVMDYLFVELMLWGKAQGFAKFNLGMAPLSGLDTHALGPRWHRLGNFLYQHGEHFYNFTGLRRYKAKFHPDWEPRYLASPGGLAVPQVLADVSILISGGVKQLVTK